MMTIYVAGYLALNLGDDLFFKILFERYPQTHFIIYAPHSYRKQFGRYNNVTHLYDNLWSRVIRKIRNILGITIDYQDRLLSYIAAKYKINAVAIIGGSIFIEPKDGRHIQYETFCKYKQFFPDSPIFYLGCNFGPYKTESFKSSIRKICLQSTDVCFRDHVSYQLFETIPNVRIAKDLVFGLKHSIKRIEKKEIGISIIDLSWRSELAVFEEKYITKIIEIIAYYFAKGYKIKLFSFCKLEGDETAIVKIIGQIDESTAITRIEYDGNIPQILNELSSVEYLVASRFHAMILGFVFGCKVYPLAYNNKTADLLKTSGQWNDIYHIRQFVETDIAMIHHSFIDSYHGNIGENQFLKLDTLIRRSVGENIQ